MRFVLTSLNLYLYFWTSAFSFFVCYVIATSIVVDIQYVLYFTVAAIARYPLRKTFTIFLYIFITNNILRVDKFQAIISINEFILRANCINKMFFVM